MTTFLAIADRSPREGLGTFSLEKARIGVLHSGHIFTYLPNDSSWIYNEAVERDYFADKTELSYQELPPYLAQSLALCMRPVNPLVATMLLEKSTRYNKIMHRDLNSLVKPRDQVSKVEIARWILKNGIKLPRGIKRGSDGTSAARASNFYRDQLSRRLGLIDVLVVSYRQEKLKKVGFPIRHFKVRVQPVGAAGLKTQGWPTRAESVESTVLYGGWQKDRHLP